MHGTLAVVGLGYVGLPLAALAAEKGWRVIGYDVDAQKVAAVARGELPLRDPQLELALTEHPIAATTDPARLSEADVVVVAVPTPLDAEAHPDLGPLTDAVRTVARHARRGGVLLSVESTVNPGVCEEILVPLLEGEGRMVNGHDILLVHCPERVNPGDATWTVRNIPRVIGGVTPEAVARGVAVYETILEAPVRPMSSIRAAEAVKIVENTFRDVNIAFVNELAQSFDHLGIDVLEVLSGAATKPFAFLPHAPGCGVGGHCIPVDPTYLIEHASRRGFDHRFLRLAREVNKAMPRYTVDRLVEAINGGTGNREQGTGQLPGIRVALLGLSYKKDVDDLRESPALEIERLLQEEGASVTTFDPFVPDRSSVPSLEAALAGADAVVVATDHSAFRALRPADLHGTPVRVIVDGRNCLPMEEFAEAGIVYRGVGRTPQAHVVPQQASAFNLRG